MPDTAAAPGEVALVLHTHLPWVKDHGVWPVGEEWLFQAWAQSWLPVTDVLLRCAERGMRDVLTLGVTPLVARQVSDPRLAQDLGTWLGIQMWRAEEQRWQWHIAQDLRDLSTHWWRHHARLLELHERIEARGGLLVVWRALADAGVIEVLGGPATHPYLPLMDDPDRIDEQLAGGLAEHAAWLGAAPSGIWPPELGYRPAGQVADPTAPPRRVDRHGTPTLPRTGPGLPGLEDVYAAHGVSHVLVDAPTLIRANGGVERDWTVRPEPPEPGTDSPDEVVHDGVRIGDSDVVAFARDLSVAYHVWSPTKGYPGNAWYLDYWAKGSFGLHPSWRVTDRALPPEAKAVYEPAAGLAQAERDAAHLHGVLRDVLDPRPGGLVVAAYDTELFGHWWHEGPHWLESLLGLVADDPTLRTTTLASRLRRHPPTTRLTLDESSWGYAKGHASWVTPATRPIWRAVREGQEVAAKALAREDLPAADRAAVVHQLTQLECSDWPFMVTRGNSPDYALARVDEHLARLRWHATQRA